jgi:hypothetical protein
LPAPCFRPPTPQSSAQVQPLTSDLVNLGARCIPGRFDISQSVRIALGFGRCAAERTILVTANRQKKTGFLDCFQSLNVRAINPLELLETSKIDSDFRQPLLIMRDRIGQLPLGGQLLSN